jgi:DNA-binding transcriptional ArsR family regulator
MPGYSSMTVEKAPQPFVVDVSRPDPALAVEIDASEAAELLLTLATLPEADRDDTYVLGAARLEQVRAEAPPELLKAAELLLPGRSAAQLLGLVYLTPKPRSTAAFIELVEATDPVELRLHLLGYYMRGHHVSSPETIRRAAEGDLGAREELLGVLSDYVDKCSDVSRVLDLDPVENRRALVELLSGWYEHVFPELAPDVVLLAERDAAAKRDLVRGLRPEQVVERLAPGIQWAPGADVDRVVFFPAYSPRPWVYMSEYQRVKIFCPPIAVDRDQASPGDPADVVRIYKALADESRLKLLKRLQAGPISLAEAAQEVGLAKSTTHHHLAILRQAGFVLIREGEETYSLRTDLLPEPGALLERYLGAPSPAAVSPPRAARAPRRA